MYGNYLVGTVCKEVPLSPFSLFFDAYSGDLNNKHLNNEHLDSGNIRIMNFHFSSIQRSDIQMVV